MKRLSAAPFQTEKGTFTVLFLPLLPFSVITSTLPNLSDVREYSIGLVQMNPQLVVPVFVLVFWHKKLAEDVFGHIPFELGPGPPELRCVLHTEGDTERSQSKLKKLQALRERGVKLTTTFKWDFDTEGATFLMPESMMDGVHGSGQWYCAMWRTDR